MDIQKQIKELTLSFFKTIDAEIINENGIYTVIIPKVYVNYFQKSKIQITFDEKIAEENNCELIILGSKTLFQIITNCNNKGSISIKQTKSGGKNPAIRYHFYVNFSGVKQQSQLFSVTVDLQNMVAIIPPIELETIDSTSNFKLLSEKITPSFNVALEELKLKSSEMKFIFINNANIAFDKDFKLFISRYDDEIRELDDSINKKDLSSDDFDKIKKFRFDMLEKIEVLEKEKNTLIENLQKQHKINSDYTLVACEMLLI